MSLNLPANFKNDIQGKDTSLVPVVILSIIRPAAVVYPSDFYRSQTGNPNFLAISTNQMQLSYAKNWIDWYNYEFAGESNPSYWQLWQNFTTKPVLLNIPSLKESIDIEKRNYKISSINIDISNFPYEGKRFSELISDTAALGIVTESLINVECRVFWVSPSTNNIELYDVSNLAHEEAYGDSDAMQVYYGTIRRYTHDDEKVRLTVEDRSQATLHKDLPTAELGFGDDVPPKYKGAKIPMVFGHVDRSPCVISDFIDPDLEIEGQSSFVIKMDSKPLIGTILDDAHWEGASSFLYIDGGNSIFRVTDGTKFSYTNNQFQPDDIDLPNAEITMTSIYAGNGGSLNSLADNLLEIELERFPKTVSKSLVGNDSGLNNDESSLDNIHTPISDGINPDINTRIEVDKHTVGRTYTPTSFAGTSLSFIFDNIGLDNENTKSWLIGSIILSTYSGDGKLYTHVDGHGRIPILESIAGIYFYLDNFYASLYQSGIKTQWDIDNNYTPSANLWANNFYHQELTGWNDIDRQNKIDIYTLGHNTSGDYDVSFDIFYISLYQRALIKNPLSQNYYANVVGRESNTPQSPEIISHILTNELSYPVDETGSYDWQYAFTVDKKINSKKLIENIASASPYIPRFDNMGNFKFSTIPQEANSSDVTIKNDEVIDFSFSRTKIEDVYTKVEFKYNWDYAREEFNSSVESDIDILPNYDPTFYGFKIPDTLVYDHAESTLIIDDDRGKYIRNPETAQAFCDWFLLWSCNQHLKMKVKLPLKYMEIEIGDMVEFDKLLGDIVPYGIDYINGGGWEINSQQFYKYFMVSSTNKTLEWVEIECIMMHNLSTDICYEGYDCAGVCGGEGVIASNGTCCEDGIVDECNVCHGDGTSCDECNELFNEMHPQYYGCNPPACDQYADCNGTCGGDGVPDCEGVCDGDSQPDECGVCGGNGAEYECWDGSIVCDVYDCPTNPNVQGCIHSQCEEFGGDNCIEPSETPGWQDCTVLDDPLLNFSTFACCHPQIPDLLSFDIDFVSPYQELGVNFFTGDGDRINEYGNLGWDWSFNVGISGAGQDFNIQTYARVGLGATYDASNPIRNLSYGVRIGDYNEDGEFIDDDNFHTDFSGLIVFDPDEHLFSGINYVFDIGLAGDTLFTILADLDLNYKSRMIIQLSSVDDEGNLNTMEIEVAMTFNKCPIGDLNGDGGWNVLDIVTLANCILNNNCPDLEYACAADLNGDNFNNVLDIVTLATCILGQNCGG